MRPNNWETAVEQAIKRNRFSKNRRWRVRGKLTGWTVTAEGEWVGVYRYYAMYDAGFGGLSD